MVDVVLVALVVDLPVVVVLCADLLLRTELLGLSLFGPPPDFFRLGSPGVVPPDCSIPDVLPFGRDPSTVPAVVGVKLGAA